MEIGICDDSEALCMDLCSRLRRICPAAGTARIYSSAEELLEADDPLDILFLDVCLEGMDGLEAAYRLRELGRDMQIVFISGDPEYVFDAFDVDACGYLVKPISNEKLTAVLEKARRRREKMDRMEPRFVLSVRAKHMSVRFRDIIYAEVFNRKVVLHTTSEQIEYYGKLTDLEQKAGKDFFRTHRSFLVNLRYVDSYDMHAVQAAGRTVLLAKKNHEAFMEAYMDYIRRTGGQA